MTTTVFLDRDGTINRKAAGGAYVTSPADLELLPGAAAAIGSLTQAGLFVVVVTNQRGIALGLMTDTDLTAVHEQLRREVEAAGGRIDAIYYCPHDIGRCDCRKPDVGMFAIARREHSQIDFARSWVVGDTQGDIEAARRIGARSILIARDGAQNFAADSIVQSLPDAAHVILDCESASGT